MHIKPYIGIALNVPALALIVFSLVSHKSAAASPYKWDQWLNNLYWALNRSLFVIGAMVILFTMLIGQFNCGMRCLRGTYFRAFGRLTFICAIISPVVIFLMYYGRSQAIYLTGMTSNNIGAGNVMCVLLAAIPVYLIIEYPINRLTQVLIAKRLGHHELLN